MELKLALLEWFHADRPTEMAKLIVAFLLLVVAVRQISQRYGSLLIEENTEAFRADRQTHGKANRRVFAILLSEHAKFTHV
jgi:hypothetical protein